MRCMKRREMRGNRDEMGVEEKESEAKRGSKIRGEGRRQNYSILGVIGMKCYLQK